MTFATALLLIFLATFLWGSWLQARKFTGDFPLPTFMIWLYFSSVMVVWIAVGLYNLFVPLDIVQHLFRDPLRALGVVLCGASMAIGMYIQMKVIDKVGLILSNSVSATFGVLLGTLLSVSIGGLPKSFSLAVVWTSVAVLISATFICQLSGRMRDIDLKGAKVTKRVTQDTKSVFLLILSSVLITAYPLGMSIGVRTTFSDVGFPSLICVGLLALGSFVGISLFCAVPLTLNRQWNTLVARKYKRAIQISCFCGFCHYGGNVLHVLSSSVLSTAISWLMGRLGNMWTYLWGIFHKEYSGARKKTYAVLSLGILVYIVGVVFLALGFYL